MLANDSPLGEDAEGAASARSKAALWLGAGLVALVTMAYLALWWNRYFGPTLDGYFAFYGHLLLGGKIPYRDFYLHVPPLVPLENAALEALFGPQLIVPRLYGAFERIAIAVLGYFWLARLFPLRNAALATLAMVVIGSSDVVDILFLYNHHSVLWALATGLLASHALDRLRQPRQSLAAPPGATWLLLLAGTAAGITFLTKQTVGLGLSAALPVALWFGAGRAMPLARRLAHVGLMLFGWGLPVAAMSAWLGHHDALAPAIDELFLNGASSKGPLGDVLFRALAGGWQVPYLRVPALLALVAVVALAVLAVRRADDAPAKAVDRALWPVAVLSAVALLAGILAAGRLTLGSGILHLPERSAVLLSLYASLFLSLYWGLTALRRGLTPREGQLLLFSFVSFSTGFMFATSWPSFEPIAIPGAGFIICLALAGGRRSRLDRTVRAGVWVSVGLVVCFCTWLKLEKPYDFAGWVEPPVRTANVEPKMPALEGFLLAPSTVEFVETATRLIQENSAPGDSIFVYPHLPVLYLLADREPPTFSMIHWFDVCSDEMAVSDAERVRTHPPAMLVDFQLSEDDYLVHEAMFRSGKPSGQRRMREVLRDLESRYQLVATLPAGGSQVTLWKRPES